MTPNEIVDAYFEWLSDLVCENRFSGRISYNKLLARLHDTIFRYSIIKDKNRAEDGIDLRYRFALEYGFRDVPECLDGPCSVLEMMVALAIRCEGSIMDDPKIGDRTGEWFWGMVVNLGLGSMMDNVFDKTHVDQAVQRFLDREYEPNGKGGLFYVRHCDTDLRNVEIWYQLCWYLDSIT